MGLLHHANYLVYFEQGRTELLRQSGKTYKDVEDEGFFLVLAKVEVRYRQPARYDDVLTLRTIVTRQTPVRIEHRYELLRDRALLAEGSSTLACVDREGKLQAMPKWLQER
jgi:acyl-CoA thioester hydrolase